MKKIVKQNKNVRVINPSKDLVIKARELEDLENWILDGRDPLQMDPEDCDCGRCKVFLFIEMKINGRKQIKRVKSKR